MDFINGFLSGIRQNNAISISKLVFLDIDPAIIRYFYHSPDPNTINNSVFIVRSYEKNTINSGKMRIADIISDKFRKTGLFITVKPETFPEYIYFADNMVSSGSLPEFISINNLNVVNVIGSDEMNGLISKYSKKTGIDYAKMLNLYIGDIRERENEMFLKTNICSLAIRSGNSEPVPKLPDYCMRYSNPIKKVRDEDAEKISFAEIIINSNKHVFDDCVDIQILPGDLLTGKILSGFS